MPEFIRPKRAIIEPDNGGGLLILAGLLIGGLAAAAALVSWLADHAVLLACCLMVFCVALGGFCAWCRWASLPQRLAKAQAAEWHERVAAVRAEHHVSADQVPAPKRSVWPELEPDAAEVLRQAFGSAHKREA